MVPYNEIQSSGGLECVSVTHVHQALGDLWLECMLLGSGGGISVGEHGLWLAVVFRKPAFLFVGAYIASGGYLYCRV